MDDQNSYRLTFKYVKIESINIFSESQFEIITVEVEGCGGTDDRMCSFIRGSLPQIRITFKPSTFIHKQICIYIL
jgi:hypothetical protein